MSYGVRPMAKMGTWQGGDMWHGVGACGRVWKQVVGVVVGCWGMWQEWVYVAGGQAYGIEGDMWWGGPCGRVWEHVAGCSGM